MHDLSCSTNLFRVPFEAGNFRPTWRLHHNVNIAHASLTFQQQRQACFTAAVILGVSQFARQRYSRPSLLPRVAKRATGGDLCLPRFGPDTKPAVLAKALQIQGCAVIEDLAAPTAMENALEELNASGRLQRGQRFGQQTWLWKNPFDEALESTAKALAEQRLVLESLEILRPIHGKGSARCMPFEVRWLDVDSGAPLMRLHRDQVDATPLPLERPLQWGVNAIWAATDFTPKNGATRFVPGSHSAHAPQGSWVGDEIEDGEAVAQVASMPAGSVVLYYASVLHGSGINCTGLVRTGLNFNYCFVDATGQRPRGWGW